MAPAHSSVSLVIIDDNPGSLEFLSSALAQDHLSIFTASDPEQGIDLVYTHRPEIVLTDLVMPGLSGLNVLERVIDFDPAIDVVLMTAHYTSDTAVEAIRKGAADYLNKPISVSVLRERVGRLITTALQRQQIVDVDDQLLHTARFEGIVGRSPVMWEMFSRIRRVAPHYRATLVTGPTGTGKDLVAHALHQLSRPQGKYVVLNCSAVVETLFESELFGHMRGAFTGADRDKIGLAEHADQGTLFLDEIGDMPLGTQAKLLRVLQNQEVQRIGSLTPRRVDIRVIAATNRNLRQAIAEKQFREDLYYRLSMVEIQVPSLVERIEDLPLLTQHFVQQFAGQYGKQISGLTRRAQIVLSRHAWPGNVRELENVIGHACMMALGEVIDVTDLPEYLRRSPSAAAVSGNEQAQTAKRTIEQDPIEQNPTEQSRPGLPEAAPDLTFEDHEKHLLTAALEKAAGNQSEAARQLRIGRDALRYKMKKYGLI